MGDHLPVLSDALAGLMLAVALYCLGRLFVSFAYRGATQRDADAVHAVMGVSMAGMLAPSLDAFPTGLWLLVFGASILWFGWRVRQGAELVARPLGQHVPHLVMSAAMLYMLIIAALSGAEGMPGAAVVAMGTEGAHPARWPLLTVGLAVVLLGEGAVAFGLNWRQLVLPRVDAGLARARLGGAEAGSGTTEMTAVHQDVHSASPMCSASPTSARLLAPRSGMVCQLVMTLVMGYMLLSLLSR